MPRSLTAALLLVVVLGALGCSERFPEPTFEPERCRFNIPIRYDRDEVECGTVTVRADRDDPASGTMDIAVAVFEGRGQPNDGTPIVYLAGGPGGAPIGHDTWLLDSNPGGWLTEGRDVIFIDQRGSGRSKPRLRCAGVMHEQSRQQTLHLDERDDSKSIDEVRECREATEARGVDLDDFTTAENAADVVEVVRALGYPAYNIYGVSYGTRLALTILRDHPDGVRSVILDSAYPAQANLYADMAGNVQSALELVFDRCRAAADCHAEYPDPRGTLLGVVERLRERPIELSGFGPESFIDDRTFVDIVFSGLYSGEFARSLPWLLSEIENGNEDAMWEVLPGGSSSGGMDYGMHLAMQCGDEIEWTTHIAIDAGMEGVWPSLATLRHNAEWFSQACTAWGTTRSPSRENEPIHSEVPVLILSGAFDPITPPRYAELTASTLPASQRVTFPWEGHGLLRNNCAMRIANGFLAAPSDPVETRCLRAEENRLFRVGE